MEKLLPDEELARLVELNAEKLGWFLQNGYEPHYYQLVFHTMWNDDRLKRYRHLVAGRRGGKTLAAAYEVAYYAMHPRRFHEDYHNKSSDEPLWIWSLSADYKMGRAALLTLRQVLRKLGLRKDVDYKENRTEKYFEFPDGSLIEFKTAHEPENLRGAGLDLLWIDEAAFIPSEDAWHVVSPALADKLGGLICTTTPMGSNWYHNEFWSDSSLKNPMQGRVEYRSVDNPYFKVEEWERLKREYHPLLFKREFEASFHAMAGKELSGEWLKYYTPKELKDAGDLKLYVGVDPAISLSDSADRFAMALVGVTEDNHQAFLIDLYADRIPFPEQVERIQEWFHKYRPIMIGIEAQAYQASLVQQTMRIEGLPPIVPMFSPGKKADRLLAMSPLFRLGKIKIRQEQYDFIDEWINYDSTLKRIKDDTLDAVEIALRTAGALLPMPMDEEKKKLTADMWEEAFERDRAANNAPKEPHDEYIGGIF